MAERSGRMHPLVPPLALAVLTLFGTAIVIGFSDGDGGSSAPTTPTRTLPTGTTVRTTTTAPSTTAPTTTAPTTTATTTTTPVRRRFRGGKLAPRPRARPPAVPAWIARELGPRDPRAPLVRDLSDIFRVTLTRLGLRLRYGPAVLDRQATRVGPVRRLERFRNGVLRRNALGSDVTTVRGTVTTEYFVVDRRHGERLWTWHLETNLRPALRRDGTLLLRGEVSFLVEAPSIYDRSGAKITTIGPARWSLTREGDGWRLGLRLDDRRLPVPYVIAG